MVATTYFSSDYIKEDDGTLKTPSPETAEFLALATEPGIPAHTLKLKPGCLCSIMRNLSIEQGLVKNVRVLIKNLHRNFIEVEVVQSAAHLPGNKIFCLPRINFEFSPHFCPWTIQRKQYPLRLAYSTTFNSCQGLTLERAVLDLRTPVFAHGQLYTAISRVRHRDSIHALFTEDNILTRRTKNVVHKSLLL